MRYLRFLFTSDFPVSLVQYLLREHRDMSAHLLKIVIM
jgi:hypothetical protein